MDFTREPIIETIISAKEGFKLLVRSSKTNGSDEYSVDAIEVVSFGNVQFFRSSEKPRAFLVPVTDYEVMEVREMRLPIKNATHERSIKITPKKESSRKPRKSEKPPEENSTEEGDPKKKRTRRRTRRKKDDETAEAPREEGSAKEEGEKVAAPPIRRAPMVPPPTTLISDTISRYKDILMADDLEKKPPALPKELEEEPATE